MEKCVITIARGFGSGGRTIGKLLAQRLDIDYYNDDLIKLASEESGINLELFGKADERVKVNLFKRYKRSYGEWTIPPDSDMFVSDDNLFNYQAKIIRDLADKQSCIIIGRCANHVLQEAGVHCFNVFCYGSRKARMAHAAELNEARDMDLAKYIDMRDTHRNNFYRTFVGTDLDDCRQYNLCLDTGVISPDLCADIIVSIIEKL